MKADEVISKCSLEYERLITVVNSETKSGDIEFWDHCEESTSAMLAELNDVVNTNPPSEEFRSLFTKIQYMNTHALQQISTCEQRQREGN